MLKNKKAQIWIETVIYILIGIALIALVLAFVVPKINSEKERIIIDQTISSLSLIDDKINEVITTGIDNRRIIEFTLNKGELVFNLEGDKIIFKLDDLAKPYSEPDVEIQNGRVVIKTSPTQKTYSVELTLNYGPGVDIKFGDLTRKKFTFSPIPYKFYVTYKGPRPQGGDTIQVVDIGTL